MTDIVIRLGMMRRRFELSHGQLTYFGRLTTRELFTRTRPVEVVEFWIQWSKWAGGRPVRLWSIFDAEGACEVAVAAAAFDAEDLERLRNQLGLGRQVREGSMSPTEARAAYPGLLPWWAAHFLVLFWGAFAAIVLVIAIAETV